MPPTEDLRLVRRIYHLRTLGMALGFLCVASVFRENGAHPVKWTLLVLDAFVWPHAAYLLARRSANPERAEYRNLLTDSAMGGVWVALMAFNLLPSVILVTMLTIDKISFGGWPFLLRTSAAQIVACALASAAVGFAFAPATSMPVVIACMPILVVYPLAISTVTRALSSKVVRQNRTLAQLNRTDALTGLPNRTYWEEVAVGELRRSHRSGRPASLLMIDIDRFKQVNDRYGHAAGDELLRGLSAIFKDGIRDIDTPGRYGGDEFAIVLPESGIDAAVRTAERLCQRAEAAKFDAGGDLRCTLSIGAAEANGKLRDVREWIAAADAALYRAKESGRNRVARP